MPSLQPPRGMTDLLPDAMASQRRVMDTACRLASRWGFAEMATPMMEFTEVFARPLGETSDVVTKETYSFTDRGGEGLTLRPEGTAAVVRAIISNGLTQTLPQKLYYQGPMFRYERPQKGRLRQFHQVGVELIGGSGGLADAEVISLGHQLLAELGAGGQCKLNLNSLGDAESRAAYRASLVSYLKDHRDRLSEDSQRRLELNPLRILDSKDEADQAILGAAPLLGDYLNTASADHFGLVCGLLDEAQIPYQLNPRLVRGLDYYCHTAFEFITDALGAQGTVLGGGRYDGLSETLGGPSLPGVGWAAGVERLALLAGEPESRPAPLVLIGLDAQCQLRMFGLADRLRAEGYHVEIPLSGNLGKQLKRADRLGARMVLIQGAEEAAKNIVLCRDMQTGNQQETTMDAVLPLLAATAGQGE